MRAHTRKHRTDTFKGINAEKHEEEDSMTGEEALNLLIGNESKAAVMLRGLRYREGLTQLELGKLLGTAQANISQMERGKRSIGKQIAKRLAELFRTDYRLFL